LKPQTAQNWDAALDYYFEPVGNFSVGWFHKSIRDYIVRGISGGTVPSGTTNGYNGEYAGYEIFMTANAGTATVDGWEFSYHQQLTFLPRFLKGLSVTVNYTILNASGDFGGTTNLSTNQIPRFIPRAGNINLSWQHRGFNARILVNQNSRFLYTTAAAAARLQYKNKYTLVNAGIGYQYRPWLSFTCEVENLFNEPLTYYRGRPDRMQLTIFHGTTISFGVNGTF
jgi:TonB-dependent receptor